MRKCSISPVDFTYEGFLYLLRLQCDDCISDHDTVCGLHFMYEFF
jgi:hypothetical protein